MNFLKYEACGNDFILVNRPYNESEYPTDKIRQICHRHFGIGADGIFFVWQDNKTWFWKFFNSDGSMAKFCGNASRCLLLWLNTQVDASKTDWEWSDGKDRFRGKIQSGKDPQVFWAKEELKTLNLPNHHQNLIKHLQEIGLEKALWVQAGVAHFIIIGPSWPKKIRKLFYENSLMSHHSDFVKETNITWLNRSDMTTVTFERGVENETLSCGSAAFAAYYALKLRAEEDKNLKVPTSIDFQFPGGPLTVTDTPKALVLSGPANKIFEGYYDA